MCSGANMGADEAAHGPVARHALVCIRTGWAEARHSSREQYHNVVDEKDIDPTLGAPRMHFPGLTKDAAELLVVERCALGIGIDTLSPDGGGCADGKFEVHNIVLGNDRYILENLLLTKEIPARGASAVVAPLNLVGAPEAPSRVWAMVESSH
mmetsp:Transcript_9791/g.21877  ORF Transcript_9791/g.21877 Transcript_9791/m.21877 type:complete len:153 (-) Transcript_9791:173-631(-)